MLDQRLRIGNLVNGIFFLMKHGLLLDACRQLRRGVSRFRLETLSETLEGMVYTAQSWEDDRAIVLWKQLGIMVTLGRIRRVQ